MHRVGIHPEGMDGEEGMVSQPVRMQQNREMEGRGRGGNGKHLVEGESRGVGWMRGAGVDAARDGCVGQGWKHGAGMDVWGRDGCRGQG